MGKRSALIDKVSLRDEHGEIVPAWYNENVGTTFNQGRRISDNGQQVRPLPPHRRTWTGLTYFAYQSSVGIVPALWALGSSLLTFGLVRVTPLT